jgi:uncharacterized membrane protein
MTRLDPLAKPWPADIAADQVTQRESVPRGLAQDRERRPGRAPDIDGWLAASAALVLVANVLAVSGLKLPFVGPAIGFWFILAHPAYLIYTTSLWGTRSFAQRLGYCVTAVLLLLMAGGLILNTVLPLIGIQRPLDTLPVVVMGDLLTAGLYCLRRRYPANLAWRPGIASLNSLECRLLTLGAVCVVLAVLGTNRINNGAGDQVSLAALACIVVLIALVLRWQQWVRDGITSVAIYLFALALLLMNSLRGWYVTGHDVQTEYRVFQLTEAHGHWSISAFRSAYNACLSITILPTEIAHVVNVDGPYVYKAFFQLLFAVCPMLVYAISRRTWSSYISILAAVFFAGFPTFFNDMPSLNRQEIAFLFVCVGILSLTDSSWSPRRRRIGLFAAAVGVELSHYSTMYVFLGMLVAAWMYGLIAQRASSRSRAPAHAEKTRWESDILTLRISSLFVVAGILLIWGGLATQTAGQSLSSAISALSQLAGQSHSATPYSLLSRHAPDPSVLLNGYRHQTLVQNATAKQPIYLPASVAARYPTPVVSEPTLPLTPLGRVLSDIGVPVASINADVRQGAAKDEQLFVIVGFAAILTIRSLRRSMSRELLLLCAASLTILGIFTLFPNLSVDYGVLRAFQESLILIAPLLVVGSLTIFSLFGRVWELRWATVVCLLIFISTTGLMPELLGGYQAQLAMNNSGQYYDTYYVQPQDIAAVNWLAGKPGVLPGGLQTPLGPTTANRFYFTSPSLVTGRQAMGEAYPTQILRLSWIILPESVVHEDQASVYVDGVVINYRYPMGLLAGNKNLVYDNGGTEIYR